MTTSSVLTTPPGDRWKHAPATGEPDRWNLDGWDPFTDDPSIPDGYEQVPHTGDGWRSSFSIRPVHREEPHAQEAAEVPPTEASTGTKSRTKPATKHAPARFTWDAAKGLQSAKHWTIRLDDQFQGMPVRRGVR